MSALVRHQRGAIMVMALFMAIFATGSLHYLVGLAEAIAQRERMQDAADAAAFSAAVLHARGMNVIALINMTMAALLAVLIALKLVEAVCIVGVGLATGLAFVTAGASLVAVPPFTATGLLATEAYSQAQPVVHDTLRALRLAARGVRVAIPWVAQARTVETVVAQYSPPAELGFAVPGSLTLPTRDGTFDALCTKSGEYVGDLVDLGLGPVRATGFSVSGLTAGLVDAGSAHFCGTEGAAAPAITTKRKVRLPILPKAQECQALAERARAAPGSVDEIEHERVCEEAKQETVDADAALHSATGACVVSAANDCGPESLYEVRAARALEQCAPRAPADEARLGLFWWQAHVFKRRYAWDEENERWLVDAPVVPGSERHELRKSTQRPCGTAQSTVGSTWHTEPLEDGERTPICDNVVAPTERPVFYQRDELELEHTEVMRIVRCREVVHDRHEVDGGFGALSPGEGDDDLAPQLIANGATLGEEPFQIRAMVSGERTTAAPDAMLEQLASEAGRDNRKRTALWSAAKGLGRFSAAQAEFYFVDGGADPSSYLWAMHWSARLRRFRLPEREPAARTAADLADASANDATGIASSFESACAAAPGATSCDELDFTLLSDLIAH